jgi:hypothetical protein
MHDRRELEGYARATWRSFLALVEPRSGLPADYIGGALRPDTRAEYTSPTNVAMYLWAIVGARDLGLISEQDAARRSGQVLQSLTRLERHDASGQFYNWYHPRTGARLTRWPGPARARVAPFASSVDNGWLASALLLLANALPAQREQASELARSMDFRSYYDASAKGSGPGLLRGGFWPQRDAPAGSEALPRDDYSQMGETVVYTAHHYGAFNTEPRITSYVAIALGQLPPEHYFAPWRAFADTDRWTQKTSPVGEWRSYRGVDVFEGAYLIGDQRIVPSWGGSMFEALMPTLVVPEALWGAKSWALTHPSYVEAQIAFGLEEAGYGYWGFSPASDPAGGYREYGVPSLGMELRGYPGQSVVTPHATFLALPFAPDAALANLRRLRRNFPSLYAEGGFKDSVNVATGQVADRYLALDQGMVMAALTNRLLADRLPGYLACTLQATLAPVMAIEEFNAGSILEQKRSSVG